MALMLTNKEKGIGVKASSLSYYFRLLKICYFVPEIAIVKATRGHFFEYGIQVLYLCHLKVWINVDGIGYNIAK